jgi:hypothetical protein
MKQCKKCLHFKPYSEFYRRRKGDGQWFSKCKSCLCVIRREARQKNREADRIYQKAYKQRDHVKEARRDYQRMYKFLRRMAKARNQGSQANGDGIRKAAS